MVYSSSRLGRKSGILLTHDLIPFTLTLCVCVFFMCVCERACVYEKKREITPKRSHVSHRHWPLYERHQLELCPTFTYVQRLRFGNLWDLRVTTVVYIYTNHTKLLTNISWRPRNFELQLNMMSVSRLTNHLTCISYAGFGIFTFIFLIFF